MLTPQNLKILVVGLMVFVVILILRSCGGEKRMEAVQNGAAAAEKQEKKFNGSVDLSKSVKPGEKVESFAGFKFGTTADKFENVTAVTVEEFITKNVITNYFKTVVRLERPIRLFDCAVLRFTVKDRRLFKVILQTSQECLKDIKPTAVMREAQYCAEIIERKYGERFNIARGTSLYSVPQEKGEGWFTHKDSGPVADLIGSHHYVSIAQTDLAIAPTADYHGMFNSVIEVRCACGSISKEYVGITISAVNHEIIEEDGGRTKTLDLDEDDAEGDF